MKVTNKRSKNEEQEGEGLRTLRQIATITIIALDGFLLIFGSARPKRVVSSTDFSFLRFRKYSKKNPGETDGRKVHIKYADSVATCLILKL